MINHYLIEDPIIGAILKHKFLIQLFTAPDSPEWVERCTAEIKHKEKIANEALQQGQFENYIGIHERPYRLDALLNCIECVQSPDQYWELVHHVWVDTEYPCINKSTRKKWYHLWNNNRFLQRQPPCQDSDCQFYNDLPPIITVYRGGHPEGFSWTLSLDLARSFATNNKAKLYKMTIAKSEINWLSNARNEQEVVITNNKNAWKEI
ncbi:hypothetical protein [Photobacterium leiognathi]|uniref:hypothetical protein n=1 Tax=Photobacterium leiognathi TaxID=553611 RepID=UPI0029825CD8|nr:hypothetical protein [Photobacterium leiognathi]